MVWYGIVQYVYGSVVCLYSRFTSGVSVVCIMHMNRWRMARMVYYWVELDGVELSEKD